MKKIISVFMVAVCLMMAAPVQAQLHFGVKGGLNLSKASFSKDALKGDNQTGWFIGPMAEFTLPIIGVGADIAALYSQTDLAAKGYDTDAYIAAGPQFGFNIGNKKGFMDYELKKNNTTFNVGAGVKLIRHIQIGVNYNFALSHTATIETTNEEVIKIKNNTWQVSLAYLF